MTINVKEGPQAQDDVASGTEHEILTIDVLANDLTASKELWSAEQDNLAILTMDGARVLLASGATIWFEDGQVRYDPGLAFNHLLAGETAVDIFTYAIRMANGSVSWATVTVTITGEEDAVSGVVTDGYIAGATVFIDVNENGILDFDEPSTVSDANGDFTISSTASGPLVAIGGTNIDTGLANELVLRAPAGATVINPLTTVIQSLVLAGLSATEAEAMLQTVLGLDPSIPLLSYDILAQPAGDPDALAAQQAAASVAVILKVGESVAPGSSDAVLQQLAAAIIAADNGSQTTTLSSTEFLTSVFEAALPAEIDSASLAASTATAITAIDEATSIEHISEVQQILLVGTADDDDLDAPSGSAMILGLDGADWIGLHTVGDHVADGGGGIDIAYLDLYDEAAGVTFALTGGEQSITTVNGTKTLISIEAIEISGTRFDDVLTGGPHDDLLYGIGGHDLLDGGDGNDFLENSQSGSMLGGSGDDIFVYSYFDWVGPTTVSSDGGSGFDTVRLATGSDWTISVGGGSVANITSLGLSVNAAMTSIERVQGTTGADNLSIISTSDDDFYTISPVADHSITIDGGTGLDVIDLLTPETFQTWQFYGTPDDSIVARFSDGSSVVIVTIRNVEEIRVNGVVRSSPWLELLSFDETDVFGTYLDDYIPGNGNPFIVFNTASQGDDWFGDGFFSTPMSTAKISFADMPSGVTFQHNPHEPYSFVTSGGTKTLYGIWSVIVEGSNFDDVLTGHEKDDQLRGGSGDDLITGHHGMDLLAGGAGQNVFIYNSVNDSRSGWGIDLVEDFEAGQDVIQLSAIDANSTVAGNEAFAFVGTAAFSGTAGELRYEWVDGKTVVQADVNGDGLVDMQIDLQGQISLQAIDFIL